MSSDPIELVQYGSVQFQDITLLHEIRPYSTNVTIEDTAYSLLYTDERYMHIHHSVS